MRLPEWLKRDALAGLHDTKHLLRRHRLSTVCEEARCPNRGECFSKPNATFLILGSHCTRKCGFCSVSSSSPEPIDESEPEKVASASTEMGLRHVVITSVTRDDLSDGGAGHFAKTIVAVRRAVPRARVEILTPDFQGKKEALETVLSAQPDVFNHNIETVERLYSSVRPQANFHRSLALLQRAKEIAPHIIVKSGFMLGLGEKREEVMSLLENLFRSKCDFLTIGQYLRPTRNNLPVVEYLLPEFFEKLREKALDMGFKSVASGPLVRSSKNAEEMYEYV